MEEYYSSSEDQPEGVPQQKRWFCKTCNRVYAQYINRYLISLHVVDNTGDIWLRAFDDAATPLLGISAQELSQIRDVVRR